MIRIDIRKKRGGKDSDKEEMEKRRKKRRRKNMSYKNHEIKRKVKKKT